MSNGAMLDSIATEIFVDGEWVDISEYVIDVLEGDWGILGNTPIDKMASVGGTSFLLNNESGIFTPNTANTLAGWKKGVKIRHVLTFEEVSYVKFKGKVKRIGLPYKVDDLSVVPVKTVDWLDDAMNQPLFLQGIETNVTTAEAAQIVLDSMNVQPDNVEIDEGTETLNAVFTNMDVRANAYSELSKLALSEFSYIYLKKDRTFGETLVVEDRHSRIGVSPSIIPVSAADAPKLLLEDGSYFLLEHGANLVLEETTQPVFDNMQEMETDYGENLINQLTVRNNPSRVDTSLQVLFALDAPIPISAGQTLPDLKITYKDPTGGGRRVNGKDMEAPVSGTDFAMFANSDGTGADLTGNLSFTVEYGSSGAVYRSITNTGGTNGFITKLQARGYGVYSDNPVEVFVEDIDSIDEHGLSVFSINNQYQSNLSISETIAVSVLNQNKENRVVPQSIRLIANASPEIMQSFLNLDVGDLIHVKQDRHFIDGDYFIQSVRFRIFQDGDVYFEWGLVDALYANETYWELEVIGRSELEETTFVSY